MRKIFLRIRFALLFIRQFLFLRTFRLEYLGNKAVSNNLRKARNYGEELLEFAENNRGNWNYGNLIHKGNIILGRVALREGNTQGAKELLLRAGSTPGSPQLNSFGPNMLLAKEL